MLKLLNIKSTKSGITLIEVMVALLIISVSLLAAQNSTNNTTLNYSYLQKSILSSIIARNILVDITLQQQTLNVNRYLCAAPLAFECEIRIKPTPNKYLQAITILVYSNQSSFTPIQSIVTLLPYNN